MAFQTGHQVIKRDLIELLTQAQMDDRVRVVVFTGQGRAFSAGDDVTGRPLPGGPQLMPDIFPGHREAIGTYEGLRVHSQTVNSAIRNLDKLSIAAVNGIAIQTGLSLALSCDFRIASKEARLGSATLRFGLLPDEGGQYLLVQLMGVAKTMDFLMRKKIVSAEEALSSASCMRWSRRGVDGADDGARHGLGERPASLDAAAEADHLQRRRDDLGPRARRYRGKDGDQRPSPGRAEGVAAFPGAARTEVQRLVVVALPRRASPWPARVNHTGRRA
ncbi:enoyl-CoA hydratase/isomerase family protein [Candidatus Amarobacter glycogenicus]|uniref:enoyl-CoA hydratase/isomerase family protein n=1 Tax=Candidatus Amarobacter glycogenicus TaxID=3140699 RepID=UPI003136D46F|nr:enoyl-CoA hydratase/isomerase family protein [Dehalococcoidia bacterium]